MPIPKVFMACKSQLNGGSAFGSHSFTIWCDWLVFQPINDPLVLGVVTFVVEDKTVSFLAWRTLT